MTPILTGLILGILLGFGLSRLRRMLEANRSFTAVEYHVFLGQPKLPSQDELLSDVMQRCPFRIGNRPAIGPPEGLLFSDIRLHMALVLRDKNPKLFRPDLFSEMEGATAESLSALAGSPALAVVRYMSDSRPNDRRYLQLLPILAEAMARLGNGTLIHDVSAGRFLRPQDLRAQLEENGDAARPDLHVRAAWTVGGEGGQAETRGLVKVGLPELRSETLATDQRLLAESILESAARALWTTEKLPPTLEVEAFHDTFRLHLASPVGGVSRARIGRVREAT